MSYSQLVDGTSNLQGEPSVIDTAPSPSSRNKELKQLGYQRKTLGFAVSDEDMFSC